MGEIECAKLYIKNAVCEVIWKNGAKLQTYINAEEPHGWFRFEGVNQEIFINFIQPAYNLSDSSIDNGPVTGQDLRTLAYPSGQIIRDQNSVSYIQKGWGGFEYQVYIEWSKNKNGIEGCWSITSAFPGWKNKQNAKSIVKSQIQKGFNKSIENHLVWWNNFWSKSSISIPDKILEKQWYLEMYKFGSVARRGAPPISLQAVWTADNGKLPPWKGDFHHDLNTQLSYWPAYSSNHLDLEEGFTDWLWNNRETFKQYTKSYFETDGLNVPGVSTLTGQPMGGWIQYAFGPTVSAWLAQNFYQHYILYHGHSFP